MIVLIVFVNVLIIINYEKVMKFTHTNNTTYRKGTGSVPKAWIDYGIDNHKKNVLKYFEDRVRVSDADICGDEKIDFVFDDGKAYRLEYSWWCNIHEEQDDYGDKPWIIDNYDIEEISIDDANVPTKKERDWI